MKKEPVIIKPAICADLPNIQELERFLDFYLSRGYLVSSLVESRDEFWSSYRAVLVHKQYGGLAAYESRFAELCAAHDFQALSMQTTNDNQKKRVGGELKWKNKKRNL